ncbi:MAG: single-stranded DNA-binding protein [Cyanobacteriota bacterium]|nr:single-stranded DNA-binding protein [Cyanobacteriota bacterium]
MNSIVLMAEVLTEPELRYTPDNLAVASLLVSFLGNRADEAPYQVRVAAFGELAQQVVDACSVGSPITIEGQLHMNLVERDGRKEKQAEINARRIYPLSAQPLPPLVGSPPASLPVSPPQPDSTPPPARSTPSKPASVDYDDLPF